MKTRLSEVLPSLLLLILQIPGLARGADVTACDDANFRAAVSGGGLVRLACDGTIFLTNTVVITANTILDGSGRQVSLDGGNAVRLMEVPAGVTLSVTNVSFVRGKSTNGGAIFNQGTFSATSCAFISNKVYGWVNQLNSLAMPAEGGAIWNGATASVVRCTFGGNAAVGVAHYYNQERLGGGGALCNRGTLFVSECSFRSNSATGGAGLFPPAIIPFPVVGGTAKGGALYDAGTSVLLGSTFADNQSVGGAGSPASRLTFTSGGNGGVGYGGAIACDGKSGMTNCTLLANLAVSGAGGITSQGVPGGSAGSGFGGGIATTTGTTTGTVAVALSTLVSNAATAGGGLYIANDSGVKVLQTIVSASSAGGNASGRVADLGYNLSSDMTLVLTNVGSLTNTDPKLGPLADNGGPTLTLAPLSSSPAIDAGSTVTIVPTDQRGFPRPAGARSDIGALESSLTYPAATLTFDPDTILQGNYTFWALTISNRNVIPLTHLYLTSEFSAGLTIAAGFVDTIGFNGVLTATPGTHTVVLSNFSLPPLGGCTVRLLVKADLVGIGTSTITSVLSDQLGLQTPGTSSSLAVAGPPVTRTDPATGADFTSATLHGTINPGGDFTAFRFEYGLTAGFGQSSAVQSIPAGFVDVPVAALVENLPSSTAFYFRVVSSNQFGISYGNTQTFSTLGDITVCDESHLRANMARGGRVRIACDGVITLSNTLAITKDLELDASGHRVVLSGLDAGRVLEIGPGISVTLRNVTVTRGRSSAGAGISNAGNLTLYGCILTDNHAFGQRGINGVNGASAPPHPPANPQDGQPGGLGGTGYGAWGGALFNSGICTAVETTFSSNSAAGGTGGSGGNAGGPNYSPGNFVSGGGGGAGGTSFGGAIFSMGTLRLSSCSLWNNRSSGGVGGTGGYPFPRFGATMAGGKGGDTFGAGIHSEGTLSLVNVTAANNESVGGDSDGTSASLPGNGGNGAGGAINVAGPSGMTNCTFADNRATGGRGLGSIASTDGVGLGGNVAATGPFATLKNVILSHATSNVNCYGPIIDAGHNLSSDHSANFTNLTSFSGVDPGLGTLMNAGGPTLSIPLLASSLAIDHGDSNGCPPTDQRGRPRPALTGCDIGAFEVQRACWLLASGLSAPGTFVLRGIGPPTSSIQVQTSTNLIKWSALPFHVSNPDGTFNIPVATDNRPALFFRMLTP